MACPPTKKKTHASPPRPLEPCPRSRLGARGKRGETREVGAFPRVPASQRSQVPELGLRPVLLAVAGKCARDSGWDPNASLHSARSGGPGVRQGPLARRSPAASFPISKARDPGLELCPHWVELLMVTRPRQTAETLGNLLGSRSVAPVPAPARAHGDPRLPGALTDPDDVGHPAPEDPGGLRSMGSLRVGHD